MENLNTKNNNPVGGFVRLSRQLFNHPFWLEKRVFSYAEGWLDLIQKARFDPTPGNCLIKKQLVTIERGELVISLRTLSENWGWSTSKLRNFLSILQSESMITIRNAKSSRTTIITICKYNKYNPIEISKKENKTQTKNTGKTQTSHKQHNNKKIKKVKKCESYAPPQNEDFKKFTAWMKENTPHCLKPANFPKGITEEQFLKLKQQYSGTQIADTLLRLENRKDLHKRYTSLYLTLLNWLKKDYGNN